MNPAEQFLIASDGPIHYIVARLIRTSNQTPEPIGVRLTDDKPIAVEVLSWKDAK